ncbi:MAG TPA: His-Xaa-Ser system radical SAM maturase HxsC [Kofleriaceae bacterium]|jgi:His-Xaa-Ser system radical SAM maturase HxsC|nr:His-Xaa-Ser system radical SAM maturase HxsC [Kofleriaceae bacterium]
MPIRLGGRGARAVGEVSPRPFLGRISTDAARCGPTEIWLAQGGDLPAGFRAYLLTAAPLTPAVPRDSYVLAPEFAYLSDGDIIRIEPARGALHTLYRRSSRSNSLLVTERCNNDCVMCSQPPKARDDSWIVDDLMQAIPLMSPGTPEIGITGGEPTLLGPRLVELVQQLRDHLPGTAVHVLSNGRGFAHGDLARMLAGLRHPDLMIGIPLYADVPAHHDYVVQARGAFDETIRGILNLKRHGVRVELRFVIHAETYAGLPAFARFVVRNLLFVDHVALMGLELMGFARTNLDALWIDPLDYQCELQDAVETLDRAGLRVSIYNTPLCVLTPTLHRFARAAISDWKNMYFEECDGCALRVQCGGFFASSAVRRSRGIARVASGYLST